MSTMKELKTQLTSEKPKRAITNITKVKGGACSVDSEGDLPRGAQQTYDVKRRSAKDPDYAKQTRDILFSVSLMASSQDDDNKFIHSIFLCPEPVRDWSLLILGTGAEGNIIFLQKTHNLSNFRLKFSYPILKTFKTFIPQHVQAFYVLITFYEI